MKNLILAISLISAISVFGQNTPQTRIKYNNFDKKLFDSLFFSEINNIRQSSKSSPLIFDSICHKSADMISQIKNKKITTLGNDFIDNPQLCIDYNNNIYQVKINDEKKVLILNLVNISFGKDSNSQTYGSLPKFILDYFSGVDFLDEMMISNEFFDVFLAVGSDILEKENSFELVVTTIIASK